MGKSKCKLIIGPKSRKVSGSWTICPYFLPGLQPCPPSQRLDGCLRAISADTALTRSIDMGLYPCYRTCAPTDTSPTLDLVAAGLWDKGQSRHHLPYLLFVYTMAYTSSRQGASSTIILSRVLILVNTSNKQNRPPQEPINWNNAYA